RRSGEIPRYLAWLGQLSNEHLKLIWDAARESAHESIRHAVLQLLQGLFPRLAKEQLDLVNAFARRLPRSEFDMRTLLLLKHLAAATVKLEKERVTELGAKRTAELEASAPAPAVAWASSGGRTDSCARRGGMMSGLEVLWQCVQDDSPGDTRGALPLALHEEAFSCLLSSVGQLGGSLPCSIDPRVWLLDEVVTSLQDRKSVVQALRVLRALLDSFQMYAILVVQDYALHPKADLDGGDAAAPAGAGAVSNGDVAGAASDAATAEGVVASDADGGTAAAAAAAAAA
ncbi:unnamed protein product, partial [Hapterophycus canaliculatus]